MLLLTNFGMIKMDMVDGKNPEPVEMMVEELGDQTTELQGRPGSRGAGEPMEPSVRLR